MPTTASIYINSDSDEKRMFQLLFRKSNESNTFQVSVMQLSACAVDVGQEG